MSRHVSVCVPHEFADRISHLLYNFPHAFKIVRFNTFTTVHLSFKVSPKHLQEVIVRLGAEGCGESYGTIDVFACLLTRPLLEVKVAGGANKKPKFSVSDRLTVDEIEDIVDDGNHLTFDYMALIAVASVIAGVGLITDSATVVIAAMLVSPLMGPILSLTFGTAVLKTNIVWKGIRNEVIGVVISILVGLVCGFTLYGISGKDFNPGDEMLNRGRVGGLVAGSVVAAASGMGVILALSKGGVNAIVGTSISASLLPPCVNTGICTAYGICIAYLSEDYSQLSRYKQTALVSLLLYLMNFILIVVVGILTLRYIKKIYPHDDPRNLPNNPHLNIPRSLMSESGAPSVSSSVDVGGVGEMRDEEDGGVYDFPYRDSPEEISRKMYGSSPFASTRHSLDSGDNSLDRPLLQASQSLPPPNMHRGGVNSGEFCVENSVDSPQALFHRAKQARSNKAIDVSEL